MVDVGKREDRMLDLISDLTHRRDEALDWINTYTTTGVLKADEAEWLRLVLKGE
jgi:hypothetical protein